MGIKIIEGGNNRFLSSIEELKGCLPDNVMLNKVVTGCGLTTMALTETRPYVVCVPYVSLVKNKEEWCRKNNIDVLAVYDKEKGGATKEDIATFKGSKIIVTWNSLPKVVEALKSRSKGECKGWKILIDECHQLVSSGTFRYKAIDELLDLYPEFGAFIFATATPVPQEYQLPRLENIPRVAIRWDNLTPISIVYTPVDQSILKYTAGIALDFLEGRQEGNAHIFINSVRSIVAIVGAFKERFGADYVKIVCADNDESNAVQVRRLGKGYKIESTTDAVKKINFYTATAFEGSDIYDEQGRTFVVSDGSRDHTKIDIRSTLPQIVGRIRDTRTRVIELICSNYRDYSNVNEEEYSAVVKDNIEKTQVRLEKFAKADLDTIDKEVLLKTYANDPYISVDGLQPFVNTTVLYSEMAAFRTIHTNAFIMFVPNATVTQNVNGDPHIYNRQTERSLSEQTKIVLGKAPNFKILCEEYSELMAKSELSVLDLNDIAFIKKQYEGIIPVAYDALGFAKLKALKFNRKSITDKLIKKSDKTFNSKMVKLLKFRIGSWYSSNEIKTKLAEAYATLASTQTAKATDIEAYYNAKGCAKRVKGAVTNGFSILGPKVK